MAVAAVVQAMRWNQTDGAPELPRSGCQNVLEKERERECVFKCFLLGLDLHLKNSVQVAEHLL